MGVFHEYIQKNLTPDKIEKLRIEQLARIGKILKCEMLTYAARTGSLPVRVPVEVNFDDMMPFVDVLGELKGERIGVILETPGGFGEVGRDMVELLHERFAHVMFIVPGMAKSTGTIMAMGGHEILMGPASSLGPIDAQIIQQGKQFSADALIEAFEGIKKEVEKEGQLNSAYIPMLQQISPGELQSAINALEFARAAVSEWLEKYKFAEWNKHSDGRPVTAEERKARAREISMELSRQGRWYSHGRSIRIPDLTALKIKIRDYSQEKDLNDAISRYYALLRLTFNSTSVYKLFESPKSRVAFNFNVQVTTPSHPAPSPVAPGNLGSVAFQAICPNCKQTVQVQVDFEPGQALQPGHVRMGANEIAVCPHCKTAVNLQGVLADIEKQVGRRPFFPPPRK